MTSGSAADISVNLMVQVLYSPGDTSSHTYTVEAINALSGTNTVYVNRMNTDGDSTEFTRGASALTLMEVSV